MGYKKSQFVTAAFDVVGMAGYVFDLSPEQLESATRSLDMMMATWNGKGIRVGYPIPGSPEDTDMSAETGVPDSANEAITYNLGLRLAASFGKTVSPQTQAIAKQAYDVLLARAAMPIQQQFPNTLPLGAGNKPWRGNGGQFAQTPTDPLLAGNDGEIDFN